MRTCAYWINQIFKGAALGTIVWITLRLDSPIVAVFSVLIIGTVIASEGFITMLVRSWKKEPTDENIVKLLIALFFRNEDQVNRILDDYKRDRDLKERELDALEKLGKKKD